MKAVGLFALKKNASLGRRQGLITAMWIGNGTFMDKTRVSAQPSASNLRFPPGVCGNNKIRIKQPFGV